MNTSKGLCITCMHNNECRTQANHNGPILFCEEFEIDSPRKRNFTRPTETMAPSSVKGLCQNCDNLERCNYSKTMEVYNCNEYRVK